MDTSPSRAQTANLSLRAQIAPFNETTSHRPNPQICYNDDRNPAAYSSLARHYATGEMRGVLRERWKASSIWNMLANLRIPHSALPPDANRARPRLGGPPISYGVPTPSASPSFWKRHLQEAGALVGRQRLGRGRFFSCRVAHRQTIYSWCL